MGKAGCSRYKGKCQCTKKSIEEKVRCGYYVAPIASKRPRKTVIKKSKLTLKEELEQAKKAKNYDTQT